MPAYLPPETTYDVPRHCWVLTECWWFRDDGRVIRIPAGFAFDLASVPRPLWPLLAPPELSIAGSLVHDLLYQQAGQITDPQPATFSRAEADRLLRTVAEGEGVSWLKRWAAWLAVRGFGWLAWGPDRHARRVEKGTSRLAGKQQQLEARFR